VPGDRAAIATKQVAVLLRKVLHSKPAAATHWSVRSVAAHTGISKSTVARYFALFGLQPHRSKSFKLSTDPFFVEKVATSLGFILSVWGWSPLRSLRLSYSHRAACRGCIRASSPARDSSVLASGCSSLTKLE
jgi:AraC-like DNA-binding protein